MEKEILKDKLMRRFKDEPTRAFTVQELANALHMAGGGQFKFIVQALTDLEHEGTITLKDDHFKLAAVAGNHPEEVGVFHANDRGFGFVTVDPDKDDYFIGPTNTMSALNGDEVAVQMINPGDPASGRRPEGKVTRIVTRVLNRAVGEFLLPDGDEHYPDGVIGTLHLRDKKLASYRFLVMNTGLKPKPHELVIASISAYPDEHIPGVLEGAVTKVLGNVNDPGMDITQIVYEHNIPHEFPDEVKEQVSHIPDHVTAAEKEGRVDLTDQPLVTIDSIESKDLDDAVNVWKLDNGNYHLGVHIADVSHYVTPGTPLDKEAFKRGTSVYLTDRVIPMLPKELSNGICSLNPHVERLAMTCEMEINSQGEVVNHKIFPSVIRSTERMTYVAINKILESDDEAMKERYHDLVPMFRDMAELHKILLRMRHKRGAIEFDDNEAKVILDDQGHPVKIELRERGTSERMVESFMLAANETVAKHYHDLNVPFVYRIHENPDQEKVDAFLELLQSFGIHVKGRHGHLKPKDFQGVLKQVAGNPEEATVSTMMLRAMQQAKYAPSPAGHFGLAAKDYTHFTSPIRRYPDLMVHRLIRWYKENGTGEEAQAKYRDQLDEITAHSSETERRAVDTERDSDALKKAEYMKEHVGEVFDAVVSSVTKFGMFIALPNTVEGLIHISELKDDYYEFVEKALALVGRRKKRTFRIGQEVRVKLINVNVEQQEVDFTLVDAPGAPKTDLLEKYHVADTRRPRESRGSGNGFHRDNHRSGNRQNNHNYHGNRENGHNQGYHRRNSREHSRRR